MPDIIEIRTALPEYREAINTLLPQLSSTPHHISKEEWPGFVSDSSHHIYLLRLGEAYIGMLTLGIYTAPTGRKGMIEDVVVHQDYRGKGYGRLLIEHAIAQARHHTPISIMLTSRPTRVAANALYCAVGFTQKETNVYVMKV